MNDGSMKVFNRSGNTCFTANVLPLERRLRILVMGFSLLNAGRLVTMVVMDLLFDIFYDSKD